MDDYFRPIREEVVMCTVQGCLHVAAFVFSGGDDRGGRAVIEAYCHQHAEEAATRLGHPWPIPERHSVDHAVRARAYRAAG
jgi:hypothetical protein